MSIRDENVELEAQDAIVQLRLLQDDADTESAHHKADNVLCRLLADLGFGDVVNEYGKIEKWCA